MSELEIRRAEPQDAEAMTRVFAAAYAPFLARIPDLPDVTAGLAEDIRDHIVWLAQVEGRVVGGLVMVIREKTAVIANLAVDPNAGGRGFGRALIAKAEEEARARAATRIDLATHVDMPQNLVFYTRLGWVETGRDGNKVSLSKPL